MNPLLDPSVAETILPTVVGGTLVSLLAGSAFAWLAVPKIADRILPKPKETRLADHLPFDFIEDDGRTVRLKDGGVARFYAITGIDQNFLSQGAARTVAIARKRFYDALSEHGVTIRIYTVREPIDMSVEAEYPNPTVEAIASKWNRSFENSYRTYTVLCLSMKESKGTTKFDEAIGVLESVLDGFRPRALGSDPSLGDITVGAFLGRLASPIGTPEPVKPVRSDAVEEAGGSALMDGLSDAISSDEVVFLRNGLIRFRNGGLEKYCAVIGFQKLGDEIDAAMSNDIAALPAEMVILQTVEPKPKAETLIKLKQQQKMVASTSMSGQGVYDQYHTAILMVEGMDENKACLCVFSETIFLFAADKDGLLAAQKECIKILNKHGVTACQEKGAAQISWFGLFPSKDVKPRSYRLMSPNVAVFATFDRPATGLPRSEWGPGPIARFRTGSNTVYDHQFHISTEPAALGHGLCIAPTGAGKTVLMQFFSAMASRHRHLRQFFFDRLQGTYVYTTAMNGKYLGFNAEKFTRSIGGGMNPFQCEDNDDTRDFLKNWLIGISKCSDHESFEQISQAIELAFDAFGRDERSLRAIFEGAFSRSSNLSHELRKWVDPAQYGKYFNADQDCIDLSDDTWLTTFDMTNLFHDDTLAAATMQYLMFRIQQTMSKNDAPGFIFIDETAPMLQDPKFRAMYLIMLREFRKKHGVVISVFQSPDAIKQSGIAEQIRQAMSAYYLFPAKSATAADYEDLQLTDREMAFVLGHWAPPGGSDRMILIKRPSIGESVVVDVNLAPLGKHFKVFSSDGHNVKLASEMQAKFGDDWLIHYLSL